LSETLSPVLAGAGAASVIVVAGDGQPLAFMLATITGIAFGDLTRRARRENATAGGDVTDLASSLAFLAVLVAAAIDVGDGSVDPSNGWLGITFGVAVIALAMLLRQRAIAALGASFVVRLDVTAGQRLVEEGPYRWIRHPNYCALLAVAVGTALSLSSPLAAVAIATIWLPVTMLRIVREERLLAAHFGERYEQYRRRSWRLVPGIY